MDIWSGMIDGVNNVANEVFNAILFLLPTSPFSNIDLPPIFIDYLGYLNYYVPIDEILITMTAWLSCIMIYYAYQLVLRWAKAVS